MVSMKNVTLSLIMIAIGLGAAALVVAIIAITADGDRDAPVAQAPAVEEEGGGASKADPGQYTVRLVDQAIAYYREQGREAAIARYSSPDNVDGDWYVVMVDSDNTVLAHYNPDIIGESLLGPVGADVTGYEFGAAMAGAGERGRWVSYVFHNPSTGQEQVKHAWTVRHDGLLFISG
jgi:hypothetical protein